MHVIADGKRSEEAVLLTPLVRGRFGGLGPTYR